MEPEFDQPMMFDKSRVPDQPAAAGVEIGSWGYEVQVYGAARGHKRKKETPSLLTNMCGFSSEQKMQDARQYLQTHGNYQIEQVSVKSHWSHCIIFCQSIGSFVGHRGCKVTGHFDRS